MDTRREKLETLKKEKNAVIMAHYYVPDEVQEIVHTAKRACLDFAQQCIFSKDRGQGFSHNKKVSATLSTPLTPHS